MRLRRSPILEARLNGLSLTLTTEPVLLEKAQVVRSDGGVWLESSWTLRTDYHVVTLSAHLF
jgi:hypothetical protein